MQETCELMGGTKDYRLYASIHGVSEKEAVAAIRRFLRMTNQLRALELFESGAIIDREPETSWSLIVLIRAPSDQNRSPNAVRIGWKAEEYNFKRDQWEPTLFVSRHAGGDIHDARDTRDILFGILRRQREVQESTTSST